MTTSTQIQLVSRPRGWPTHDDFRTVVVDLPAIAEGEVRVANEYLSVDPYMRGRMNEGRSYIPPFELNETMTGGAVGRVVESRSDAHPVGAVVMHDLGWRDVAQGDGRQFRVVQEIEGVPVSAYLGILGTTGLTAYVGLLHIGRFQKGESVFVSGAAGSVGSAVGQIARLMGASKVVGSAGSAEKVDKATSSYGFDSAINYKDGPVRTLLREHFGRENGEGIDVYFDNVGGDHLEAALDLMNDDGRLALCGAISSYNATERSPGPDNMWHAITRGLTLQGFTVNKYMHLFKEFAEKVGPWVASGEVVFDETVVEGIDNSVDAFLDLMRGANVGKMLVKI
ncbi:MAG: NADP-dependent oxidoreductase [Dietzia sp.]|uniref:NADP-dependent oxidoreductase n=1 Tax=Dietzia TaxID=37914 RepID=UPI0015FAA1AA|nr:MULTISPECIES: NADP-dependent oxidoreductase [unclassified Dietzia]MBB1042530.1 NADP-dependent oxidoreductase [Dietzia sp. Cai40]MBB1045153.1 NADP-dependent oxidoreductase [Dietzia sp. DQ11-44]MBB1051620.1 NADP-dependent oxidoreductase [Dietzia sp. CW19]MBC7295453.1 NADP-dependent oxidoreductase [Dietzia sp.]MDO8394526.1 NADP-dependent oxidoreductase [Dietzia sp.]